ASGAACVCNASIPSNEGRARRDPRSRRLTRRRRGGLPLTRRALGAGARRIQLRQLELEVAWAFAGFDRAPVPLAVAVQIPRALVVGEGAFQRVEQLGAQF